ncbi:MAG: hemerythrin family protein [Endomicrobia bacterium]|nr:hemerythrin family protein [Endomicrobiia bacterium]
MQKIYNWDPRLETGNNTIDAQHKSMFAALNDFIAVKEQGKAVSEIQKTMEFLAQYIIQHFDDEEKLQEECGYPHILEHKNSHENLRNRLSNILKKLDGKNYDNKIVEQTIRLMADWLTYHIKGFDFNLAAYIRNKDSTK